MTVLQYPSYGPFDLPLYLSMLVTSNPVFLECYWIQRKFRNSLRKKGITSDVLKDTQLKHIYLYLSQFLLPK